MAKGKGEKKKARELPYLPRFAYRYCIDKIIALNKYVERPCGPSKFARDGLGLKSAGTIGTAFSCLRELGWIQKVNRGYDLTNLGTKVARYVQLGLKEEASKVARQTIGNVETLKGVLNYVKIKKKSSLKEIQNYLGTAYGEYYRFSPRYLHDIAQNCVSFLEAARTLQYNPTEKVYEYLEKADRLRKEEKVETKEEVKPDFEGEPKDVEMRLAGMPVRLDIQVTDKTDVEELRKRILAVRKMLKEETK